MPPYLRLGSIPRKRHIAFRKPDGGIYNEELVGHEGFTGTSSLLYHVHPPTTVKSVKRLKETCYEQDPDKVAQLQRRPRVVRARQVQQSQSQTAEAALQNQGAIY